MAGRPGVKPDVAGDVDLALRSLPEGVRQHVVRGMSEGGLVLYVAPTTARARKRYPLGTWLILPPWVFLVLGSAGALGLLSMLGAVKGDGLIAAAANLVDRVQNRTPAGTRKNAQSAQGKMDKGETPTEAELEAWTAVQIFGGGT